MCFNPVKISYTGNRCTHGAGLAGPQIEREAWPDGNSSVTALTEGTVTGSAHGQSDVHREIL